MRSRSENFFWDAQYIVPVINSLVQIITSEAWLTVNESFVFGVELGKAKGSEINLQICSK